MAAKSDKSLDPAGDGRDPVTGQYLPGVQHTHTTRGAPPATQKKRVAACLDRAVELAGMVSREDDAWIDKLPEPVRILALQEDGTTVFLLRQAIENPKDVLGLVKSRIPRQLKADVSDEWKQLMAQSWARQREIEATLGVQDVDARVLDPEEAKRLADAAAEEALRLLGVSEDDDEDGDDDAPA